MSGTMWNTSMVSEAVDGQSGPEDHYDFIALCLAARYLEANEYPNDPADVESQRAAAFIYDVLHWSSESGLVDIVPTMTQE